MNVRRPASKTDRILFLLMSGLLTWISCTQQNPMEPAASLVGKLTLLANMSAAPSRISTGGQKSQILVNLRDEEGKPIPDKTVSFQTTLGSLTRLSAVTDANGWAKDTLQSGTVSGWARVTASYQQAVAVDSVQFSSSIDTSGYILQLSSDEIEILANGASKATLTVSLVARSGQSAGLRAIGLSTTAGSIPASVLVSVDGITEVILTSEAKTKDILATVTAAYDQQTAAIDILMKGVEFRVEANPKIIFADGGSYSTVRAFLRETSTKIGIPGEPVRFGTDHGTIQAQEETDDFGVAEVRLISETTADTATVMARYGQFDPVTVKVEFLKASFSLAVSASSASILANGVDFSTVTAVVKDATGKPIPNKSVYFSSQPVGSIDYVGTTDYAGSVQARLISEAGSADRTATVTVTVDEVSKTLPVLFRGVRFSITADPTFLIANGSSQAVITAAIRETTNKIGVNQAAVQFGTNLGTIPGSAASDNQGIAQVKLTSSQTQGTAEIVGRYGSLFTDTVLVQFGSSVPAGIQGITANPGYILANGTEQAFISVKVVDAGNAPVVGTPVNFSATAGTIQTQDLTDGNGVAMVSLVSSESATDVVSTVTASLGAQSVTASVVFEGIQMAVGASPLAILADGHSTSAITVVMKRATSKIALPGASLQFATDLGTIPALAVTNSEGVAHVALTSGTVLGTAHVTVLYGTSLRGNTSVNFQESLPTYLEASATPPVLPADGQSQSLIKATVSDANRNPVPNGTLVQFDIVSGSGSIERQKTTLNGVATTQLTAGGTPGTTMVRVTVGSLTANVQVVYTVGEVYQVIVTSDRESMPADGIQVANIQAKAVDAQGNAVSGQTVQFTASVGDITPNAPTNAQGIATAQFSSGIVGTATITASVQRPGGGFVSGTKIIQLLPGSSNTIVLRFDPTWIGVKDTGQNQTMNVSADIKDSKNNPVIDGTLVKFSFIGSNLGCAFSTSSPIPTVGGTATISLSSGILAGSIRIKAEVVDEQGLSVVPPISATSTQLLIHAGPPYMEDPDDAATTHVTVAAQRLNIWAILDTTKISLMVGDKYNNPVERNTAVYFTTSGGVVSTHTAYTDDYGKASVTLTAGNPQPNITNYYMYMGLQDPNNPNPDDPYAILGGLVYYSTPPANSPFTDPNGTHLYLPDFEADPADGFLGEAPDPVMNSRGNTTENDGIARIIGYTEGKDASGNSIRPWDQVSVAMTYPVAFIDNSDWAFNTQKDGKLYPGEYQQVRFFLVDPNGNPVQSGTVLTASLTNTDAKAKLSWTEDWTGAEMGRCDYYVTIASAVGKEDSTAQATAIRINWKNSFLNTRASTESIVIMPIQTSRQ